MSNITDMTAKMTELYAKTLDAFLRQLGVTEQDAGRVTIAEVSSDIRSVFREIRRDDKMIGSIYCTTELSGNGGIQFVVRCTPPIKDTRTWQ